MTLRIAVAILLTTWTALIAIGGGSYLATRHALLTDLDESIIARATALPRGATADGRAVSIPEDDRYLIRNGLGQTLARPTTAPAAVAPVVRSRSFSTLADGTRLRTITLEFNAASAAPTDATTITYSTSAERFDRLLDRLVIWLIAIGAAAGLVAAGAAVVLSRIALRPLLRTADAICEIDERKLDRRIEDQKLPAELAPMATRLNELLARLESAFAQRTRFLADASHELRTPVAALMTTIEVAIRRPRSTEEMGRILRTCLTDVRSLRHLVDRLMQQVRGETAALEEPAETFDLVELLNGCVDTLVRACEGKSLTVRRRLPTSLFVRTQRERVRGIVTNLLSNAFEYTPDGGTIDLQCTLGSELVITVADSGAGIPADLQPRLFTPFARGDQRRDTAAGHIGLGLSIVQAHCQALGGCCVLEKQILSGAAFGVHLPAKLAVTLPSPVEVPA